MVDILRKVPPDVIEIKMTLTRYRLVGGSPKFQQTRPVDRTIDILRVSMIELKGAQDVYPRCGICILCSRVYILLAPARQAAGSGG